jgi:hypothetical protein
MEQSLFAQYVQRYFPILKSVIELINGRRKPLTYLHKGENAMLEMKYAPDNKWESASINASNVAADVVAQDSELPLKSRHTLASSFGKLPKVGMKKNLKESDINTLNVMIAQGATDAEVARVDNLMPNPDICSKILTKSGSKAIGGEAAIEGTYNSLPKNQRKQILKDAQQWVRINMPKVVLKDGNNAYRTSINNVLGNNIIVNQDYFNEVFAKNIMRNNLGEIMKIAKDFAKWMPRAKFVRQETGEHHNFPFNVYEVLVNGKRIEVKTKLTNAEYLYTLRIK